ncbi:MAG: hypothetical protein IJM25_03915 [Eubacterium sp.]|nr:hypothetical protein [Eubacterium sp.]
MGREADIAIRRNYFEDTILLVGDFKVLGHNMNFVLRVSSFGSRSAGENLQVYFGLLDDTMRDFTETSYLYPLDKIRVSEEKLMIRADDVEIYETAYGLKAFVKYDEVTLDFLVSNDGHKSGFEPLGKGSLSNRMEGYTYPYCSLEGTALIGTNYCEVEGQTFYVRRFQNHGGFFDRRLGQTAILRGGETGGEKAMRSLYGFFVLSNGRRVLFASYGNDREQDDFFGVSTVTGAEEIEVEPILISALEYGGEVGEAGMDVTVRIRSVDGEVSLKTRRDLARRQDVAPDNKDFCLYDRFARMGGRFRGEKVSGYGCMIYT